MLTLVTAGELVLPFLIAWMSPTITTTVRDGQCELLCEKKLYQCKRRTGRGEDEGESEDGKESGDIEADEKVYASSQGNHGVRLSRLVGGCIGCCRLKRIQWVAD